MDEKRGYSRQVWSASLREASGRHLEPEDDMYYEAYTVHRAHVLQADVMIN